MEEAEREEKKWKEENSRDAGNNGRVLALSGLRDTEIERDRGI